MGYNATDDFDTVMDTFLEYVPEEKQNELILKMYWHYKYEDWDTEEESAYYEKIRQALDGSDESW